MPIELFWAACRNDEVKHDDILEWCLRHLGLLSKMSEVQRFGGRLFLHEHPWPACSLGFSFVQEIQDRQGAFKATGDACRFKLTASYACQHVESEDLLVGSGSGILSNLN